MGVRLPFSGYVASCGPAHDGISNKEDHGTTSMRRVVCGMSNDGAVDSWRYDPAARVWSRLADMPQGANRRALTYADRYILLVAGYKYGQTWHLDGTVKNADPPKDVFEDTVLVYDAVTGQLSSTNSLIERTSYPSSAIVGNTIYCLGGEGGPRLWHPATFHIGKIAD